jgi:tetratricopeptide (TPR) repeat protein
MKCLPLLALTCSIPLNLALGAPAWADAGVDARVSALTLQIERAPDNPALRLERAEAYIESNEPQLALADISVAETRGDPVQAAFTHGLLLYDAGDFDAARPYFDRYLLAYPEDQQAREYRARLLRDTGESRLALADYEYLLAHSDSLDPGYYLAAARLMAGLPDRGVDEALALLDARVRQRGLITPLQRYAIELETNRGQYQRAIKRMAGLDQRLKATPQWQAEIAELWLRAGQPGEALPFLTVAEEQLQSGRPTSANRELLATVHRLQDQARRALDQASGS